MKGFFIEIDGTPYQIPQIIYELLIITTKERDYYKERYQETNKGFTKLKA